jgi:hypothetical protein
VSWSIVIKVKRTLRSPFFGAFPSNRIPKPKKGVNVHFFVHSVTFRDELIMGNALAVKKKLHSYRLRGGGGGGGGGDFHSEDFRFVLWIVQEAPCFIPCDYIKEFVVSITRISIRSPEMPICISFLLTNTAHVQHIVQNTESPSYRNSNF